MKKLITVTLVLVLLTGCKGELKPATDNKLGNTRITDVVNRK